MKKYKSNREEKMSEIQERLMNGTKEIYESGTWAEYISVMSKFPNYSINNCILIASQCPHASYVCGYKKWNEFNRNVLKGESGIMIFAPIKGKVEVEEPKFDEKNQPVLNDDGTQTTEKVMREYKSFRPCYVFDLSQTEGEPLPTLASRLEGGVEDYEKLKEVLISISPVPITFEEVPGSANGFYSPTEMRIVVQDGMPELQTIKTMLHEISHATYGHGGKDDKWDKQSKEIQAESTAFWVAGMLGLDTGDYSFGYITGWSKDREVSELKENLELIKNTANDLVTKIDEKLAEYETKQEMEVQVEANEQVHPKKKSR